MSKKPKTEQIIPRKLCKELHQKCQDVGIPKSQCDELTKKVCLKIKHEEGPPAPEPPEAHEIRAPRPPTVREIENP